MSLCHINLYTGWFKSKSHHVFLITLLDVERVSKSFHWRLTNKLCWDIVLPKGEFAELNGVINILTESSKNAFLAKENQFFDLHVFWN